MKEKIIVALFMVGTLAATFTMNQKLNISLLPGDGIAQEISEEEEAEDAVAVVAVEENQVELGLVDLNLNQIRVRVKVLVVVEVALVILEVVNQKLTGIKIRKLEAL